MYMYIETKQESLSQTLHEQVLAPTSSDQELVAPAGIGK